MSQKGYSPDNSACEGFFGRLKNEMFYGKSWKNVSIDDFITILDQYIQWYANKRIKVSLGGLSPIDYKKVWGCRWKRSKKYPSPLLYINILTFTHIFNF